MEKEKGIDYEGIGARTGRLVSEKQKAYGDSYGNAGKVLEILFPNGVRKDQYKELLAICRVLDKLFRLANDPTYGSESPWQDITGYGLLRLGSWEEERNKNAKNEDPRKPPITTDIAINRLDIDLYQPPRLDGAGKYGI